MCSTEPSLEEDGPIGKRLMAEVSSVPVPRSGRVVAYLAPWLDQVFEGKYIRLTLAHGGRAR